MRKLPRFAIPITLVILGIILLAYSVIEGKGEIHWILIIPVFTGTSIFAFIGTILIIAGIFLFFWYVFRDYTRPSDEKAVQKGDKPRTASPQAPRPDKKFGGVVLIGPIPVIFGSDPKMTIIIIVLAIVLIIVTILLLTFYLGSL